MNLLNVRRREFILGSVGFASALAFRPSAVSADPTACTATTSLKARPDRRHIIERRALSDLLEDDPAAIAKLRLAYANMMSWSAEHPNDPRSWSQQSEIHRRAAERSVTDLDYTIHGSYYFFPWHRAYLYFHERILAWHLTGQNSMDGSFRLPVWNWDSDFNLLREPKAYTAATDDAGKPNPLLHRRTFLAFDQGDTDFLGGMRFAGNDFFGYPPRMGFFENGSIENSVHGRVHVDTGGDMSAPPTSAKDPIFFAHHANVDKLWAWWAQLPGATADPKFADWSRIIWTFTDWDGTCVGVHPSDLVNHEDVLRYSYAKPTIKIVGPSGSLALGVSLENSVLLAGASVKSRLPKANAVSLKLTNAKIPGPGRFAIAVTSPRTKPQIIGTFVVFSHHLARATNVFLDITANKAELLRAAGASVVLVSDVRKPHQHTIPIMSGLGGGNVTSLSAESATLLIH